ncbi:MAG: TIM barrel protein [Chloroflexota bacterium]
MKFGVNTFVWASPFSTAEHLSLIDKVDAMGFDVIEIAVEDPAIIDIDALDGRLREVESSALVCGAFGPGRNLASEDADERRNAVGYIRELIDMAAALGSPVVSGPMYGAVGKTPAPDLDIRQRERDRSAAELRPWPPMPVIMVSVWRWKR